MISNKVLSFSKQIESKFLQSSLFSRSISTYSLSNGFQVGANIADNGELVTVSLATKTGSAKESKENNGCANLFSKLAFKNKKLSEEIESLGGIFWSDCDREQVSLYGQVQKKNLKDSIDILSRVARDTSLIDENDFEEAKQKQLDHMEKHHKFYNYNVLNNLHSSAYQGKGLGQPIQGFAHTLQYIDKKALDNYVNTQFSADSMALSVSGHIDSDEVNTFAESAFGHVPSGTNESTEPSNFIGSEIKIWDETVPHIDMVFGVPAPGYNEHEGKDFWATQIIKELIGTHSSSDGKKDFTASNVGEILHQGGKLRYLEGFHLPYEKAGLFGVHFILEDSQKQHNHEAVAEIFAEFRRIAKSASQKEVSWAKYKLGVNTFLNYDNPVNVVSDITKQLLFVGSVLSNQQKVDLINSVSHDDVRRVCGDLTYDVCPVGAAVGDLDQFPEYGIYRSKGPIANFL